MSMRRTIGRAGLRLIQGEGQPKPGNTPAGNFAKALDQWTKAYAEKHQVDLKPTDVLAVYLQMAAALGVEIGATSADLSGAVETFFIREFEARKGGDSSA